MSGLTATYKTQDSQHAQIHDASANDDFRAALTDAESPQLLHAVHSHITLKKFPSFPVQGSSDPLISV